MIKVYLGSMTEQCMSDKILYRYKCRNFIEVEYYEEFKYILQIYYKNKMGFTLSL